MANKIGKVVRNIIAGANVATVAMMILVGYSYYINPESFPRLATMGLFFPFFVVVNVAFIVFWFFVKKRCLLIPIVGLLLCSAPIRTYCPLNLPSEAPDGAIKILTYNTLDFGHREVNDDGVNHVVQYIKDCDADIVCLQEANRKTIPSEDLRKMLDKYQYFSGEMTEMESQHDLMLISKYPIVKAENLTLEDNGNGAMAFWLDVSGDTTIVVNCHLRSYQFSVEEKNEYREMLRDIRDRNIEGDSIKEESKRLMQRLSDATALRSNQARVIAEFIEANKGKTIIVSGDFNDNPISYTHHTIARNMQDCFVASGNGLGISFNEKGFFVRIDHILCSENMQAYGCKVDKSISVSDHYPVYCWLSKK